jgi:hypothetical protein
MPCLIHSIVSGCFNRSWHPTNNIKRPVQKKEAKSVGRFQWDCDFLAYFIARHFDTTCEAPAAL